MFERLGLCPQPAAGNAVGHQRRWVSPPQSFPCCYLPQKTNLASYFEIFRVFKVFHRVKFQPAHLDNWVCPELFVTHGGKG